MNTRPAPVFIFVADMHFSEKPPRARSCVQDWLAYQDECVRQLRDLQHKYKCPIVIAGDVFDRWDSTPRLINAMLAWWSGMEVFCIAGNHDTPNHNPMSIANSAYWTMVEAGAFKPLISGGSHTIKNVIIDPFGFGTEVHKPNLKHDLCLNVAVIHDYIWSKSLPTSYKDAPESKSLMPWLKRLQGYDVAVFGDNHKGFMRKPPPDSKYQTTVINCGSFMRRHIDEQDYEPCAYVLSSDGTVIVEQFNRGEEEFVDLDEAIAQLAGSLDESIASLSDKLGELYSHADYFRQAVQHWIDKNKLSEGVKKMIFKAMETKK